MIIMIITTVTYDTERFNSKKSFDQSIVIKGLELTKRGLGSRRRARLLGAGLGERNVAKTKQERRNKTPDLSLNGESY